MRYTKRGYRRPPVTAAELASAAYDIGDLDCTTVPPTVRKRGHEAHDATEAAADIAEAADHDATFPEPDPDADHDGASLVHAAGEALDLELYPEPAVVDASAREAALHELVQLDADLIAGEREPHTLHGLTDAEIERCHMDEAPVDNPPAPNAGADARHAGDAYQATGMLPSARETQHRHIDPRSRPHASPADAASPDTSSATDADASLDEHGHDDGGRAAKSPTTARPRARAIPGFGIEPGWQVFAAHLPPAADAHLARLAYWSGSVRAIELMLYLGSEATLPERQEAARHLLMEIATFSADIEDGGEA